MKKVGIMTFHRALNYGAKLQAFALMEIVNQKEDAYILDYRCKEIESAYFHKKKPKDILKIILFPRYCRKLSERECKFKNFDKFYKLTETYESDNIQEANQKFDAFIVGSDQVWNPFITGYDYNYLLTFADKEKTYSYAASFGKAQTSDWDKRKLCTLLSKFQCLLTREETAADMIYNLDKNLVAVSVLDPVFLLSKGQWIEKLSLKPLEKTEKYIFVYIVAQQTYALERAKRIASEKGYKILFIDAGRKTDRIFTKVNDAGPIDFLNLLLNAELVITTSFHALAFSLIFNVPFQYELSKEKVNANSRLSDLAENLGIEHFEIKDPFSEISSRYNWETIGCKIEVMK
jgi:hypothetical protein